MSASFKSRLRRTPTKARVIGVSLLDKLESIRCRTLSSDKVFDVIGRLLENVFGCTTT